MASFIATADWHIGARLGSAGRAAMRFRERKYETAGRVIALAGEVDARAVFLLGDTFDGDGVGLPEIRRTLAILEAAPCPVFVLPGNHDWWHEGGALASFARLAEGAANVSVLAEPGVPLRIDGIPGATFFPCPVLRHAEVADPTAWIPPRDPGDGVRIGVLHGALDRGDVPGNVPERVAEVRDLDLALLGDWHKPVSGPDGRTFYAGSIEPGGFGEAHAGGVIFATVDQGRVGTERVPVGSLSFHRIELTLESGEIDGAGPGVLREALDRIASPPADTALRIRLSGRLDPAEMNDLDAILEAAQAAGWAECDVRPEVDLVGEPDLDAIEEEAFRAVAEAVWKGEGDPAVRRRALAILAEKLEEVR